MGILKNILCSLKGHKNPDYITGYDLPSGSITVHHCNKCDHVFERYHPNKSINKVVGKFKNPKDINTYSK
jgi:hypothetical protein